MTTNLQSAARASSEGAGGLWPGDPLTVGPVGLEPTTYGLKVRSSAN